MIWYYVHVVKDPAGLFLAYKPFGTFTVTDPCTVENTVVEMETISLGDNLITLDNYNDIELNFLTSLEMSFLDETNFDTTNKINYLISNEADLPCGTLRINSWSFNPALEGSIIETDGVIHF